MKILILQLGRIGDMILATPIFRAIKEKYPEAEIHALAGRHNYPVIMDNPRIARIRIHDKSPAVIASRLISLRSERYDFLIDPKDHYSKESMILARIARAGLKIGFNPPGKSIFGYSIPSDQENFELHFIERLFHALKPLGIAPPEKIPLPELFLNPGSELYVGQFLAGIGAQSPVVINISASSRAKMWQAGNWISFINSIGPLQDKIIISFAPAEREDAEAIADKCKAAVLFHSRSVNDVFSLVSRCRMLLSPDTAVVHIAAAFDRPLLGLYSGLDNFYKKFRPLSSVQSVVRAAAGDPGIASIEPGAVLEAFRDLIKKI